jgi:hypothetical protein
MKKIFLLLLLCVSGTAYAQEGVEGDIGDVSSVKYKGKFNPSRKGYMGIVESYFGTGRDIGANSCGFDIDDLSTGLAAGVNVINGYRFGHHFAMGLGVGFRTYFYSEFYGDDGALEWEYCLPVFAHLRSNILKNDVSPYVALNVGWNPSLSASKQYSSFLAEPSIGLEVRATDRSSFIFGLGFTMLACPDEYDSCTDTRRAVFVYKANFTIGAMF